jgi:hypothetical protein
MGRPTGPIFAPEGGSGGEGPTTGPCRTSCEANECGSVADGCGAVLNCGTCDAPATCGGGGTPNRCGGGGTCVPDTCETLSVECGQHADGCGGIVTCNACTGIGEECVLGQCEVTVQCTPATCPADAAGRCGAISDGCGNTIDCGFTCAQNEICGINEPGRCGVPTCTPLACQDALVGKPAGYCGAVADGCGQILSNCGTVCTGGETCGGGGTPDECGQSATTCVPLTIAACGNACGQISDGCGGVVDCASCTAPDTCGGGGTRGVCGSPACTPTTCEQLGFGCGVQEDGCGGVLSSCGSCGSNEVCQGGHCQAVACTPHTAIEVCAGLCGPVSDGCSGVVQCGNCTAPNTCGGGGTHSVCGAPACVPKNCQQMGAACGYTGDGCSGAIFCGDCAGNQSCRGNPGQCVANSPTCSGLECNQTVCQAGNETTVRGVVYAPNGTEPLYNALVYVPNAPLPAISAGPSCERCEDEDLGNPLVAALTGPDGAFELKNVPATVNFPLVVKMGKWRRVVTIPAIGACSQQALGANDARLPKHMTDAPDAALIQYVNIPRMAMVTGSVDEIECVLRKVGVDDREFTRPSGAGRVHLYRDGGNDPDTANNATPAGGASFGCNQFRSPTSNECTLAGRVYDDDSVLFANNNLNNYDIAIFGCEGSAREHNTQDAALRDWANRGGRVFASHYAYTYLHDNGNFANTATWGGGYNDNGGITTGIIDSTHAKGAALNNWLGVVGAYHPTHGRGYIEVRDPRGYVQSAASGTERFVYTDSAHRINNTAINAQSAVQQYSFHTPVGSSADAICGKVLYSAFHVSGASDNYDEVFPRHCESGPLTAQERVLEFMLFDLAACVSQGEPPQPPQCTPNTCASAGANCGFLSDGCGGLLDCGTCTGNAICGGAGTPNTCGTGCTLTTCGAEGVNCGTIADGCGGTLDCGTCTPPAVCGGGGTPGICGTPPCTPLTCSSLGASCGTISDGCGGTLTCGNCTAPAVCGGGGVPYQCGVGQCVPQNCAEVNANCGFIGDGCGGTVNCGTCPNGSTCGAGGPNRCGQGCQPRTCVAAQAGCGFIGDGCGGVIDCGDCTAPQTCGGGGVPSQCGGSCTVQVSCQSAGAQCGRIGDGCGGQLQCGTCPPGQVCGGGGQPNRCGAGSCTPTSCDSEDCGLISDGCSSVVDCGTCSGQGCVPRTCQDAHANCGPVADGCGGLLDCGVCNNGDTCGGGGTPSVCGGGIH